MTRILALLLCASLAACGGSDDQDLAASYGLKAEAEAWVNLMPSIVFPDQPAFCTQVIVRYRVIGAVHTLPQQSSAKTVSISKNSMLLWSQPPSQGESGQNADGSLDGVARGCLVQGLAESDFIDVSIEVQTPNQSRTVATRVQLYAAS